MPPPGAVRGRLRIALLLLAAPIGFLAAFFAYPLGTVLGAALGGDDVWSWLASPYVRNRVQGALVMAVLSVLLTLAIALPLAWMHHRYALPWRRVHMALHAAPFTLPVFVVVYGIQGVLGPRGLLDDAGGMDVLSALGPLGAVVLANAYYNYGFAARLLSAALDRRPLRAEEAARTLGAGPLAVFGRITLPLIVPALAAVALLVFLFSFTSFGVVFLMGAGKVSTLETLIFANLGGGFARDDRAAALGILQLALNVGLLSAYLLLLRRARAFPRDPDQPRRIPGAGVRGLALLALALGLLPALTVLAGGFRVGGEWTLEAWRAILDADHQAHLGQFDLGHALLRSTQYAVSSTLIAILLTLLLAYGARLLHPIPRRAVELAGAIPLGTSSILVGLGFLLAFGAGDPVDVRGEVWGIILAHTLVAFPFAARIILPALEMHDARQDEAALLLGAPPSHVVTRIHLPQLRPALAAAAGLCAAISLGDFGASLILMRTDTMSLAVWIARHHRPFDPLMMAQATALAGLLMVLSAAAFALFETGRRREVRF